MEQRQNKIRGCLIGGAVGDALGYQIEFTKNIKDKEFTKYKDDYGIISDDTQMTLFTANGLLWGQTRWSLRGIAPKPEVAIYYAYLDWLETQVPYKVNSDSVTWIKKIKELNVERAPGLTCINSLSNRIMGTLKQPINDSKGCGGVMRVAPIGLYLRNAELAGEVGAEAAAITHGHIYSSMASFVFAAMINILLKTDIAIEYALEEALALMRDFFKSKKICRRKHLKGFIKIMQQAVDLSKKDMSDIEAVSQLGTGSVAEECLSIAIYSCLKHPDSFQDAIVCAVNHDGDSDSTGAVAGNIMGVKLGYAAIPIYYSSNLELRDVILEIANDLAVDMPVSQYSSNNDKYWMSKYVACERDLSLKRNLYS